MCNDWVLAIYDRCVITSLIEHTNINTQVVCEVDRTVHGTFIRADYHHVIAVQSQIRCCAEQCLDELISRTYRLESAERDCILYTRIVRIKCNDIVNAKSD